MARKPELAFGIPNTYHWRGEFEHPWFFETMYHRLMDDYSEEFVFVESIKTGIIFEFRLFYFSHFGYNEFHKPNCILMTSTSGNTMFLPRHGDIERSLRRILKGGAPKASKTSHTGKVCFGEKFFKCYAEYQNILQACEMQITEKNIKLIWDELQKKQLYKKEGLI